MANGKAQVIEQAAWDDAKRTLSEIIAAFGAVLILPALIVIGAFFGVQAGFIRGAEKTIELFKKVGTI
jgi:hypothetical protein